MATPEEQQMLGQFDQIESERVAAGEREPALSVARLRKFFAAFITLREQVKTNLLPRVQTLEARMDALEARVRALEPPPPP